MRGHARHRGRHEHAPFSRTNERVLGHLQRTDWSHRSYEPPCTSESANQLSKTVDPRPFIRALSRLDAYLASRSWASRGNAARRSVWNRECTMPLIHPRDLLYMAGGHFWVGFEATSRPMTVVSAPCPTWAARTKSLGTHGTHSAQHQRWVSGGDFGSLWTVLVLGFHIAAGRDMPRVAHWAPGASDLGAGSLA